MTRMFIRAGTFIDGLSDTPKTDVLIVGTGDRITEVTDFRQDLVPDDANFIDLQGSTVMPGLIDAHVHILGSGQPGEERFFTAGAEQSVASLAFECLSNAQASMAAGWTTLRDVACRHYVDVDLRNAINDGLVTGPRLWVSGLGISSTAGHMDFNKFLAAHASSQGPTATADSPDEARRAVRQNLARDVDLIKFNATLTEHVRRYGGYCAPEMTEATMAALIDEAHLHGRRTTAHCYGGEGATWAIRSGVDCIEHGFYLDDDQLRMMADLGTALCPTLSVVGRFRQHPDPEPRTRKAALMQSWREKAISRAWETTRRAISFGVTVICGDDAAMPYVIHGTNAYELELLLEAGMTPMQAIRSATGVAADAIDFPDVGAIEAGRYLDLVAVNGDPLKDIRILQDLHSIPLVIKGGEIVADRRA